MGGHSERNDNNCEENITGIGAIRTDLRVRTQSYQGCDQSDGSTDDTDIVCVASAVNAAMC